MKKMKEKENDNLEVKATRKMGRRIREERTNKKTRREKSRLESNPFLLLPSSLCVSRLMTGQLVLLAKEWPLALLHFFNFVWNRNQNN